jgi:ribosomal-protein-alanine N-acetyltransferase
MDTNKLFGEFPQLADGAMCLRKIGVDDLEEVFALYSNKRIFEFCGILNQKNKSVVQSAIGHFERDFNHQTRIKWGIAPGALGGRIAGIIEATDFNRIVNRVTIGYFLHPDHWHRGFATAAVTILTRFLIETVGVNRVQAEVMPGNVHSKQVLLKNGFRLEGTLRQAAVWPGKGLLDLEMYSRLASDEL